MLGVCCLYTSRVASISTYRLTFPHISSLFLSKIKLSGYRCCFPLFLSSLPLFLAFFSFERKSPPHPCPSCSFLPKLSNAWSNICSLGKKSDCRAYLSVSLRSVFRLLNLLSRHQQGHVTFFFSSLALCPKVVHWGHGGSLARQGSLDTETAVPFSLLALNYTSGETMSCSVI